ncbi:uracil-DNA glycosylase [Methylocella sp.]|uniref:uracil-DNA glycosylase n=1 Tax=Methylocella sp. TaxID=1978226 RepID=UPI0037852076
MSRLTNRAAAAAEPPRDCPLCPRLVELRSSLRETEPSWSNAPVETFGAPDARLLVLGLAPGLRGANRTGRPFTGDYAGELLYETLIAHGFAAGLYRASPDDGLALKDCAVTNAVRCVPPQNKPTTAEIAACRPFLVAVLETMPRLEAVVALGRIAHDQLLRALGEKLSARPFGHGARHALRRPDGAPLALFDSYHCSRYNANTGVLTPAMFHAVFAAARRALDEAAAQAS